eukprot:scaffold14698_cov196-Amphora_coffeaeformis.AAC.3
MRSCVNIATTQQFGEYPVHCRGSLPEQSQPTLRISSKVEVEEQGDGGRTNDFNRFRMSLITMCCSAT